MCCVPAVSEEGGADNYLERTNGHPVIVRVNMQLCRLTHHRLVRMSYNERIHTVQRVSEPFVAVYNATRQCTAARTVRDGQYICRVGLAVIVRIAYLQLHEGHIFSV